MMKEILTMAIYNTTPTSEDTLLSILLIIAATILVSCFMAVLIFISKNPNIREKVANKRIKREEIRAMRKRMK